MYQKGIQRHETEDRQAKGRWQYQPATISVLASVNALSVLEALYRFVGDQQHDQTQERLDESSRRQTGKARKLGK